MEPHDLYTRYHELANDIKALLQAIGGFNPKDAQYKLIINEHLIFLSYLALELAQIKTNLINAGYKEGELDHLLKTPTLISTQSEIQTVRLDLSALSQNYKIRGSGIYIAKSSLSATTNSYLPTLTFDELKPSGKFVDWVHVQANALSVEEESAGNELEETGIELKKQINNLKSKLSVFEFLHKLILTCLNIDCLQDQINDFREDILQVENKLHELEHPSTPTIKLCQLYSSSLLNPTFKKDVPQLKSQSTLETTPVLH
jgi:hypothetical protein